MSIQSKTFVRQARQMLTNNLLFQLGHLVILLDHSDQKTFDKELARVKHLIAGYEAEQQSRNVLHDPMEPVDDDEL